MSYDNTGQWMGLTSVQASDVALVLDYTGALYLLLHSRPQDCKVGTKAYAQTDA